MKQKGTWLFWTDAANTILFLALAATGVILEWVLPHGSGGGGGRGFRGGRGSVDTFLDWSRHDWGDVHFWIAVSLVAGVLIHLLLHFGWIRAATPRFLFPFRRAVPAKA